MPITGKTTLFPIVGHPVSGVYSPTAFNTFFDDNGHDMAMVALDIPPTALDAFWSLLRNSPNMAGCSVTYPHKQAAFCAVDELTPRANRLGAVNTVRVQNGCLIGEATDGLAMCAAVEATGISIADCRIHVLGAGGGAGIAIVDALCEKGATHVVASEVNADRADSVSRLLAQHWPHVITQQTDRPYDILINATMLGKHENDPCPFAEDIIEAAALVCDVVTGSTQLCRMSQELNVGAVSGGEMGQSQLELQLAFLGL